MNFCKLPLIQPFVRVITPVDGIITLLVPVVILPLGRFSVLLTVMSEDACKVNPFVLFKIRYSKVVAPVIDWLVDPIKFTALEFGVNTPVLVQLPNKFISPPATLLNEKFPLMMIFL